MTVSSRHQRRDPVARGRSDDAIGVTLGGRYRLLGFLGSGASAEVFLAEDLALGRRVAVKRLRPGLADDAGFLRRFRAEAQAAAQLSHPNLLAVHDWGEDGDAFFIVTEVLLGGSLLDINEREAKLSLSQGLLVALQVARGLDYAHQLGWVHRDIKPANLLFGPDGRLRIADFGIARAVAEAGWTEPAGQLVGTARYVAPEQAEGGAIDGKADVYSLALTVVEAVTGRVPLLGETPLATMVLRKDRDVGSLDELGPLGEALAPACRADPAARPSASDLISTLTAQARLLPRPDPLPLVPPSWANPVDDGPSSSPSAPARQDAASGQRAPVGGRGRPARHRRRSDRLAYEPIERPAVVAASDEPLDGDAGLTSSDIVVIERPGAGPPPASTAVAPGEARSTPSRRRLGRPPSSWLDDSKLPRIDEPRPTTDDAPADDTVLADPATRSDVARVDRQAAGDIGGTAPPSDAPGRPVPDEHAVTAELPVSRSLPAARGAGRRSSTPADVSRPPTAVPPAGPAGTADASDDRGASPVASTRVAGLDTGSVGSPREIAESWATSLRSPSRARVEPGDVAVEVGATGDDRVPGSPGSPSVSASVSPSPSVQESGPPSVASSPAGRPIFGEHGTTVERSIRPPGAKRSKGPRTPPPPAPPTEAGADDIRIEVPPPPDPKPIAGDLLGGDAPVGSRATSARVRPTATATTTEPGHPADDDVCVAARHTIITSMTSSSSRLPLGDPRTVGLVGLALLALVVLVGALFATRRGSEATATISTRLDVPSDAVAPDYVGGPLDAAEADAVTNDWRLVVTTEHDGATPAGAVLEQSPPAGTALVPGDRLDIVVSLGAELVAVPPIIGLSLDDASSQLADAGLTLGVVERVESDAPVDAVIAVVVDGAPVATGGGAASSPAGRLPRGTAVDVTVSRGSLAQPMPSFVGLTLDQAIEQANDLGVELHHENTHSDRYEPGFVVDTQPPTGAPIRPGDTVTIVLSLGAEQIVVPDVSGQTSADAAELLFAAGLEVSTGGLKDTQRVGATEPPVGTALERGATVTLFPSVLPAAD